MLRQTSGSGTPADAADVIARWLGPGAAPAGAQARALVEAGRGAAEKAFELVESLVAPGPVSA